MKLAIIHPFLFRYARGIERFTWSLAGALSDQGVSVDLLTWRWPRPVDWGITPGRVVIRQMPYFRYFMDRLGIPYYLAWMGRQQYDWIMIFFAGYGEAEALRLLRACRPQRYCVVFHFPQSQVPRRYAEFERYGLAPNADRRVAVSQYVARGVEQQFGGECSVIGNGVDPLIFRPCREVRVELRRRMNVPPDAPVLVSLAALEERKGIQWVIRALPHLITEFPDLHYWIVGDGSFRGALQAEISQHSLEGHVHLLGRCDDVVPYLAAADLGCLLSQGESFGIALIEYMAMELPVVASRQPPFDELVRPEWGVMVDERDSQAVASELRALLCDAERRRDMGQAGRQEVLRQHTWPQVADAYVQLLSSAQTG